MAVKTVYKNGARGYVDTSQPDVTVPGVTSIVGMLPKSFLQHWAAKMSAELAVDSIAYLEEMARHDRAGAIDYVKGAATRYTKARSAIGSDAHDLFERLISGERVGRVSTDMEPYRRHFEEFLAVVNPELVSAENVAWSDEHEYAGSYDAILVVWIDEETRTVTPDRSGTPALLMVDYKTSKSIYPDVALQLSAYAHADRIMDPDGNSEEMPDFDGGAVLHVTPDGWTFTPVDISEQVFEHFLSLRHTFIWDKELSKRVIGKPLAGSVGPIVTGTERRAR